MTRGRSGMMVILSRPEDSSWSWWEVMGRHPRTGAPRGGGGGGDIRRAQETKGSWFRSWGGKIGGRTGKR